MERRQKQARLKPHNRNRQRNIIAALALLIIAVILFRQSPALIEKYYYGALYPALCLVLRPLVNAPPFSLGDVLYAIAVVLLIFGLVRLLRFLFKRQFGAAGKLALRFIICLQTAWLWFYLFWGLNYYRPPAAELLNLQDTAYSLANVARVTALIIDSANNLRSTITRADSLQKDDSVYSRAKAAVFQLDALSAKFKPLGNQVKPSLYSRLLNHIGTAGYYDPFTTEAQLNSLMPWFDKPFTACHEMAHQTGWAREDEANFAGYLAAVRAPGRALRYSAYYEGIGEFMRYLRRRDTLAHKQLRLRLSPRVLQDFKTDSAYWSRYQGGANMISGILYDGFLKANNQPHGLQTYNRMIRLTMAWYRRQW